MGLNIIKVNIQMVHIQNSETEHLSFPEVEHHYNVISQFSLIIYQIEEYVQELEIYYYILIIIMFV